jgi:hypothetical protein
MTSKEITFSHLDPVAATAAIQLAHAGSSTQDKNTKARMVRLLNKSRNNVALAPSTAASHLEYIASVLQEAISIADAFENDENEGHTTKGRKTGAREDA